MSSLFISYRRDNESDWASWLSRDLAKAFDLTRFLDLASILPGVDFECVTPPKRLSGAEAAREVGVGRGLRMRHSEAGDVTGIRGASHSGGIDLLQGATLTSTKWGDVTRIDASLTPTGTTT